METCAQCPLGGTAKREIDNLCEVEHVMTGTREAGQKQFAMAPSATGTIARLAYARAKKAGIALSPLLSQSGLTIAEIENRHLRLKVKGQITFLGLVADALRDNLLGFRLAHDFDLREIGLLYYVMTSSGMLEDALRRGERYSRIVNEAISVELDNGSSTTIRLKYVGVERHLDRHQVEFWLTTIIRICRQLTSRRLVPSHIRVMDRQTREQRQLEAFFGCKVEFGADVDEIVLPDSVGQLSISSADPYLNELLIECGEEALSRRKVSRGSLRPDLENAIALLLPHGKAHAREISRKLGMSERTLARRLSREGLTLTRVLGELKLELAKRHLQDKDLTISDIAWLFGYREASAFTHAFHRWFGKTPREMRSRENDAQRQHAGSAKSCTQPVLLGEMFLRSTAFEGLQDTTFAPRVNRGGSPACELVWRVRLDADDEIAQFRLPHT
jgi:AraC-like DNA-binding protein